MTPPQGLPSAPGPSRRVLIIDDEDLILFGARAVLRQHGHRVAIAASCQEAQQMLSADDGWDVILCDVNMPGLSGIDLFEWLQANKPSLAERLVFMTGGAFTPRAQRLLATCGNIQLEKPISAAQFIQTVRELTASD